MPAAPPAGEQSESGTGALSIDQIRRLPRNVWAVTLTSFLTDASTETITGLLPFYLAQTLGASPAAIGLIEGVADATASIVKLVSGWISDRIGRRKPLAVFGYGLSTGAKTLLLGAVSWPAVLVVRFLERAGKGIRTAPRDALLADSIPPETRGIAFGLHRAGDTAGAVVGLSIALLVVSSLEAAGAPLALPTFRTAVVISLIPAIAAVLILAGFAREMRVPTKPGEQAKAPIGEVLADRRFRAFVLAVVFFSLANSSDAFLLLRLGSLGLDIPMALLLMIVLNAVYAVMATPIGGLSDRVGRRRVLLVGWGLYAVVYLALGLADAAWQAWPIIVVYGLYYAATEGVGKAFVADLIPSERRGRGYGVYNAAIGVAALPASVIGGLAWEAIGPAGPFLLGAILAGVGLALLWRVPMRMVGGEGLPAG